MVRGYITIPIMAVLGAFGFLYYSTVFVVIDEWLSLRTSQGFINATIFTSLAFMSLSAYVISVVRDPGHVPPSYVPDIEDQESPLHEIKRKGGDLRYCQKCSHYKPPRAHHCRVCKTCILKMDHHCIWINNCVGHKNYKIFIVFVLHGVLGCTYSMVLLVMSVSQGSHRNEQDAMSYKASYIISGVILFPLTVGLTILLGWHIYLLLQNKTTIEHHEGVRSMWLAEKAGHTYKHPYDLGIYENLISALGPSIFCWICPTTRYLGSGLRFHVSHEKMPL